MSWPVNCVQVVYKTSNIGRKIVKIDAIRLSVSQGLLCGVICCKYINRIKANMG